MKNLKLWLTSEEEAKNLMSQILKDVKSGTYDTWKFDEKEGYYQKKDGKEYVKIPYIYHDSTCQQFRKEGKDLCFVLIVEKGITYWRVVFEPHYISNWNRKVDEDILWLHFGPLVRMLGNYRDKFNFLRIG